MKHVLLAVTLAACASSSKPAAPVSNTGPDEGQPIAQDADGVTDGALWTCQISDYDPQPCKLTKTPEGWWLAKLLGSQRFKGVIAWTGPDTAEFAGVFHCPWGECDEQMNVTFRGDAGAFVTDFGGDTISIRYDAALAGEWGGAGYGGLTGDEQ